VFSHPSKLRLMKESRGLGYRVWLVFVCLSDVYLNLDRVEQRAATGGHDVPTDKVIARYSRSIANGAAALSLADEVWLYDNSAYRKPHRLVARATAGVVTVTVEPPPNWLTRLLEIHSGLHK
jgi:predicted ABC-type ATPase